jgi:hypothetical protein
MSSVSMAAPEQTPRGLGRSVLAIFGGFVFVVAISLGTDEVLHVAKVYSPWGQLTARLAPYRPMLHAVVGAAIGMVLTSLATIGTWNKPEMGPHWYPIILIGTALPTAWLGAKIYLGRRKVGEIG